MRVFRFLGVWQRQEVRGLHAHRAPSDHLVPDRVPVCGDTLEAVVNRLAALSVADWA